MQLRPRNRRAARDAEEAEETPASPTSSIPAAQGHFSNTVEGWCAEATLVHAYCYMNVGDRRRVAKFDPTKTAFDVGSSPALVTLVARGASKWATSWAIEHDCTIEDVMGHWIRSGKGFEFVKRGFKNFSNRAVLRLATSPVAARSALAQSASQVADASHVPLPASLDRQTSLALLEAAPTVEHARAVNAGMATGARFASRSLDPTASGLLATSPPPSVRVALPRPTHSYATMWHAVDQKLFPKGSINKELEFIVWDGLDLDLAAFIQYEVPLLKNAIDKGLVPPCYTRAVLGRMMHEKGIVARDKSGVYDVFSTPPGDVKRSQVGKTTRPTSHSSSESGHKRAKIVLSDEDRKHIESMVVQRVLGSPPQASTSSSVSAASSTSPPAAQAPPPERVIAADVQERAFRGALELLGDGSSVDGALARVILSTVPDFKQRLLASFDTVPVERIRLILTAFAQLQL
jgi:hypothetical protein